MNSDLPKVLHPLADRSLLGHVLQAADALTPDRIVVVVGHGADRVREAFAGTAVLWAMQAQQLGTGHAVAQALPVLPETGTVLILYGDVPLIGVETLRRLVAAGGAGMSLLTQFMENPRGYGRIVRDAAGTVSRIVEQKDASEREQAIREVNTGIMCVPMANLRRWLPKLRNENAQGEYYLTDLVAMAVGDGVAVSVCHPAENHECLGVNSKVELATLERIHQSRIAAGLLERGVRLADPARIDVRGELTCGRDVFIDVNCVFEGRVALGDGVTIGANCVLRDATVGASTEVKPFTHVEGAIIGAGARIGPYSRLRPGAVLADDVHIGNFVEVKASEFGPGSKANHLAYVGDATVGSNVNIGAGTITCNYDGANKHRTVIGDDVHIGSDVQLIAPVTVGRGSTIGAGATISKDVPPGGLALTEKRQIHRPDWQRPRKSRK